MVEGQKEIDYIYQYFSQSKFTMRSKGWSESTLSTDGSGPRVCPPWCFRLRFSNKAPSFDDIMAAATPGPGRSGQQQQRAGKASSGGSSGAMSSLTLREKISRAAEAFLELRAQNLPLQFYMSTLNGLGDLVEDEVIPTPIPIKVSKVLHLRSVLYHVIRATSTLVKVFFCFSIDI